jgi:hypothetical protein
MVNPKLQQKFIILIDNARYGIQIYQHSNKMTTLIQYYFHYNGNNLVPVNSRKVIIKW